MVNDEEEARCCWLCCCPSVNFCRKKETTQVQLSSLQERRAEEPPVESNVENTPASDASPTQKKNIQDAKRRLRQKMVLMVTPAVSPQDELAVQVTRDAWEGDNYLRIMMEYEELQKARAIAAKLKSTENQLRPQNSKLNKSVKFEDQSHHQKQEVHEEIIRPVKLATVTSENIKFPMTEKSEDDLTSRSSSVILSNLILDDDRSDYETRNGSTSSVTWEGKETDNEKENYPKEEGDAVTELQERDGEVRILDNYAPKDHDIAVQCQVCGVAAFTNIKELTYSNKNLLDFVHKNGAQVTYHLIPSTSGIAHKPDDDGIMENQTQPADANVLQPPPPPPSPSGSDDIKVIEIMATESNFPCIQRKNEELNVTILAVNVNDGDELDTHL